MLKKLQFFFRDNLNLSVIVRKFKIKKKTTTEKIVILEKANKIEKLFSDAVFAVIGLVRTGGRLLVGQWNVSIHPIIDREFKSGTNLDSKLKILIDW